MPKPETSELTEINTIDVIVTPFWDLDICMKKNLKLVGQIKDYVKDNDGNSRLFILDLGNGNHFQPEEFTSSYNYNQLQAKYYRLCSDFVKYMIDTASHLFMGNKRDIKYYRRPDPRIGERRFFHFLQEKNLAIGNPLEIVGHGLHRGECVDEFLETLFIAIKERQGIEASYRENEATTY